MLNSVFKFLFGKEIILINRHRQILPLLNDKWNRSNFIFIESLYLWRIIPFSSKTKAKYSIMFMILNIVSPRFIIDVNWISKWHSLYFLWCRQHPLSKFIVVQHGLYSAGIVTDAAHRYSKCQVMLCWSSYFKDLFARYNTGKRVIFASHGNTIYNQSPRASDGYSSEVTGSILIAPTVIGGRRLEVLVQLRDKLHSLGFRVFLREHNFQQYTLPITGFEKVSGDIYTILRSRKFDLVISDHSSCLLDAIYFKNRVLFFGPPYENPYFHENIYSKYLSNLALEFENIDSRQALYSLINLDKQEQLFQELVKIGDNSLEAFV